MKVLVSSDNGFEPAVLDLEDIQGSFYVIIREALSDPGIESITITKNGHRSYTYRRA